MLPNETSNPVKRPKRVYCGLFTLSSMMGRNHSHVEALIYNKQGEDHGYDNFHSEKSG